MFKKVIIIGAGPAGISAAIQLKRLGIDFIIFNESYQIGGLLRNANLLENVPSYTKGIKAKDYIKKLEKHLKQLEIKIIPRRIYSIDFRNDKFYVEINDRDGIEFFSSDFLILATGTKPKVPENIILPRLKNGWQVPEIKYEIKDILEAKKKVIAIVGAGDAAFDYALNLYKNNRIFILNRSNKIKSLPVLVERVNKSKKIKYYDQTKIEEINYSDKTLFLTCSNNEDSFLVICDYLIFAIGRDPNKPKFLENISIMEQELINSDKLLYIGDLKNGIARQSSIAVGNGIEAAMKINDLVNK